MRPRLVLASVAAALTLPIVGFVITTANAAERPGREGGNTGAHSKEVGDGLSAIPASGEGESPRPGPPAHVEPSESENPHAEASGTATPTPHVSDRATATPRPTERPTATPTTRPSRPAKAADTPSGGWKAPTLVTGGNDIAGPVMASGRTARVIVACVPSNACAVSGDSLEISPGASSVTVTWSVPESHTYRAWRAQSSL